MFKPNRKRRNLFTGILGSAALLGCTSIDRKSKPMSLKINAETVIQFLHHFEAVAMKEDFTLLLDMIDERAYFRFNDGDFVGRDAIRVVFEKTWRGNPNVKKARFYLTDIVVLTTDQSTATATYTYNWEGSQGSQEFKIQGRGTRVLAFENGKFCIVHEHLSRFPKP